MSSVLRTPFPGCRVSREALLALTQSRLQVNREDVCVCVSVRGEVKTVVSGGVGRQSTL